VPLGGCFGCILLKMVEDGLDNGRVFDAGEGRRAFILPVFNHDSYGQRDDGGPYEGCGTGAGVATRSVWAFSRRVHSVRPGTILRVQARTPFRVRWTAEEWSVVRDTASTATALGVSFADIPIASGQAAPMRFTFFWPAVDRGKAAIP
jgi:hypothetical protein